MNSPVRAFRAVGGNPLFIARGKGAHIQDVDGRRFVDFVTSWGALILGHAHPDVVQAIVDASQLGTRSARRARRKWSSPSASSSRTPRSSRCVSFPPALKP